MDTTHIGWCVLFPGPFSFFFFWYSMHCTVGSKYLYCPIDGYHTTHIGLCDLFQFFWQLAKKKSPLDVYMLRSWNLKKIIWITILFLYKQKPRWKSDIQNIFQQMVIFAQHFFYEKSRCSGFAMPYFMTSFIRNARYASFAHFGMSG